MTERQPLIITPIKGLPLIQPGDNLAEIIGTGLVENEIRLLDGDIVVVAQKIVSKAEGRLVNLAEVSPSPEAIQLAQETGKDPRFVELLLQESNVVLRNRPGLIIVEHKHGYVCANAGIDHSNVEGDGGNREDWVLLLPEDADNSASLLQKSLSEAFQANIGVLITDSHGRAWRLGTVGVSIGTAGVPELINRIGDYDMFGYQLKATIIAAADQLAAAATLVMGEVEERIPVVHVRGFPYPLRESSISEVIRPKEKDFFR